jgi:hypothetical protein
VDGVGAARVGSCVSGVFRGGGARVWRVRVCGEGEGKGEGERAGRMSGRWEGGLLCGVDYACANDV